MLGIHYDFITSHLHRRLGENQMVMTKAMEKISSGRRINTAADGPADLIISEQLQSQIAGLERAMRNADHKADVMGVADGGLGMAATLLRKMKDLALRSANNGVRSKDLIAADQAEMDSALQALGSIFDSTGLGGRKLLDSLWNEDKLARVPALDPANVVAEAGPFSRDKFREGGLSDTLVLGGRPNADAVRPSIREGKITGGDLLLSFPPPDDGGEAFELAFAEGEDIGAVLAELRALTPTSGADSGVDAGTAEISQNGELRIPVSDALIAELRALPDAEAEERLFEYLNSFTPQELPYELVPVNERDRELFDLANKLREGNLDTIGGVDIFGGLDKDGNEIHTSLTLNDLFSGGAASLARDPVTALKILDQALKDVLQTQSQIGAAQAMLGHGNGELESLVRAESAYGDSDIAVEMSSLAKSQMQTQVCINLLAQAQKEHREQMLDLLA